MSRLIDPFAGNVNRTLSFQKVTVRKQYLSSSLLSAFEATQAGVSVYRAARQYGVPESTLRDRTRGNIGLKSTSGPDRIFSDKEEEILVTHIKYMAGIGYGYSKSQVQYLASDYARSLGRKVDTTPLSDCWFYSFMKRWPTVKLSKPQKLSLVRAESSSREVLNGYYNELSTILTTNDLRDKPERKYNIDETGVNTEHSPSKVLCDVTNSQPQAITSPRSSTVTIIGGGNSIGAPPGSDGEMSDSGWSNRDIFYNYLTKHFVKHANISDGETKPTLILFDGHKSHISLTLVDWARAHNIILFLLPPHTSHLTQPLDVAVFGPFKSMYHRTCQSFLQRNPGMKITKYDVANISSLPYMRSMCAENLSSAFRKTGVYPFCNSVVLDSQVAPATVYIEEESAQSQYKENQETQEQQKSQPLPSSDVNTEENFFSKRTIEKVVKKRRKRFQPPFLGSLMKRNNIDILKSQNKTKSDKPTPKQVKKMKATQKKLTATQKKLTATQKKLNASQNNMKTKSKKKKVDQVITSHSSPQPGPLAYYVDSSDVSDSTISENEEENCCVCGKFSPPALKECVNLVIVKWAQCDKCAHWTHLSFCTTVRVVRQSGEFLCPHCQ